MVVVRGTDVVPVATAGFAMSTVASTQGTGERFATPSAFVNTIAASSTATAPAVAATVTHKEAID